MMNGIVTAAEKKQSTGVHKHPMRPIPSPRMGLQTAWSEEQDGNQSRGPREGSAAEPGREDWSCRT